MLYDVRHSLIICLLCRFVAFFAFSPAKTARAASYTPAPSLQLAPRSIEYSCWLFLCSLKDSLFLSKFEVKQNKFFAACPNLRLCWHDLSHHASHLPKSFISTFQLPQQILSRASRCHIPKNAASRFAKSARSVSVQCPYMGTVSIFLPACSSSARGRARPKTRGGHHSIRGLLRYYLPSSIRLQDKKLAPKIRYTPIYG